MTLPIAYRTEASCESDRSGVIAATGDIGYSRVFAECRGQSLDQQAGTQSNPSPSKPIA